MTQHIDLTTRPELVLRDDAAVRETWCDGVLLEAVAGDGLVRVTAWTLRHPGATTPTIRQVTARLVLPQAAAIRACHDCTLLLSLPPLAVS